MKTQIDLKDLTKRYVTLFDAQDLNGVAELLHPEFVLEDPIIVRVEGKKAALEVINSLFTQGELSFKARNISQDETTTFIEFTLQLGDQVLKGVDILEWEGGLIRELRAYLDVPKA